MFLQVALHHPLPSPPHTPAPFENGSQSNQVNYFISKDGTLDFHPWTLLEVSRKDFLKF